VWEQVRVGHVLAGLAQDRDPVGEAGLGQRLDTDRGLAEVGSPPARAGRRDRRHQDRARNHHHEQREWQRKASLIAKQLHQFS
jgi:hypothetical protein